MADTLEIFGVEYTNVTGIIAKDDNGVDQTYTKGGGHLTQDQDGFLVIPPDGDGGGGGSIASATLTYSAINSTPFNLYAPIITETYAEMSGVSEYLNASDNLQTVDILLYNGASYVHIDNTVTSMSGDIEEDEDGYYFITGDCTITIS
jgi:hypothetical protein